MKTIRTIINCIILAAAVLYAVSCTAFTAPKNEHGIRQDAPAEWADTPNPLDFPDGPVLQCPVSEGNFGHCWLFR